MKRSSAGARSLFVACPAARSLRAAATGLFGVLMIAGTPAYALVGQFETINVEGFGHVPTETNYVGNVVYQENGAASYEALKAQAVAARTYAYYKMDGGGFIRNGTSDQVYHNPSRGWAWPIHHQAAADTEGEILTIRNFNDVDVLIAAFYVAGAIPSGPTPLPNPWDPDPTNTERWVTHTYPTGVLGGDNLGTPLGFIGTPSNPNWPNRGAKSQNGANFMGQQGISYVDILKYYYGADIQLETVAPQPGQAPLQNLKTLSDFDLNDGYFSNPTGFSAHNLHVGSGTDAQRLTGGAVTASGSQRIDIDLDETSGTEFLFHHVAGTEYAGFGNLFTGQREALALEPKGTIGFWLKSDTPGVSVGLNLDDDRDGTEQGLFRDVITDGQWHRYEWALEDAALWSSASYDSGDGVLGESFTLDSIVFAGDRDSVVFLDDVFYEPPLARMYADIDGDFFIGIGDLTVVLAHWNQNVPVGSLSMGDITGFGQEPDGFVGAADLNAVLSNWNTGVPPASSSGGEVPEPASAMLACPALILLLRRRRV